MWVAVNIYTYKLLLKCNWVLLLVQNMHSKGAGSEWLCVNNIRQKARVNSYLLGYKHLSLDQMLYSSLW